jgi:hypothetical protein
MDKLIEQPDNNIVDYRIVRLTDGSVLVGSITIDKDFLRIQNPLQLKSVPRITSYGVKDDSVLEQWIPFTDDKLFVIPKDKVLVISKAAKELAHYYEVILNKLTTVKVKVAYSAEEIDKIMNLADEMEKQLTEEELEEFKEKYDTTKLKTIH